MSHLPCFSPEAITGSLLSFRITGAEYFSTPNLFTQTLVCDWTSIKHRSLVSLNSQLLNAGSGDPAEVFVIVQLALHHLSVLSPSPRQSLFINLMEVEFM